MSAGSDSTFLPSFIGGFSGVDRVPFALWCLVSGVWFYLFIISYQDPLDGFQHPNQQCRFVRTCVWLAGRCPTPPDDKAEPQPVVHGQS